MGRSLDQRSPTGCSVSECDFENLNNGTSTPKGCRAMGGGGANLSFLCLQENSLLVGQDKSFFHERHVKLVWNKNKCHRTGSNRSLHRFIQRAKRTD